MEPRFKAPGGTAPGHVDPSDKALRLDMTKLPGHAKAGRQIARPSGAGDRSRVSLRSRFS